jgi:hypothetical protein
MTGVTVSGVPRLNRAQRPWAPLVISACLSIAGANTTASAATAGGVSSGSPALLSHATDIGPLSGSNSIEITVWLKLHDDKGLGVGSS